MNNVIAYVAPKNKTMTYRMSLNNKISCVVGISIFGFKTYWEKVFNLMEIKTTLTFKNLLESETLNADKTQFILSTIRCKTTQILPQAGNYEIKRKTRTCLKGEVVRTIVQGYSFKQVSSTWKRQNHPPWSINQKRSNKSGAGVDPSSTYELPQRISLWDLQLETPKNWPWGWGYLDPKQRRQKNMQQQRKRANVWRQRPLRRLKNQMREHKQ